jgi:hypothetical protein
LVKWTKVPAWAKGMTEIDHIDGDHTNNNHDNLDELCPMCHKIKGQMSGDYNNTKKHKLGGISISVNKTRVSAKAQFEALFGS